MAALPRRFPAAGPVAESGTGAELYRASSTE